MRFGGYRWPQPIRACLRSRDEHRTDVVGVFPNDRSLIRLAGMLCIEQDNEWLVGRGYLSAESISDVLGIDERNSQHGQAEERRNISKKEREVGARQAA